MRKNVLAMSAAVGAAILGSASFSRASTTLFYDDFTDGNPTTVGGVSTWTVGSVEGSAFPMTQPNPTDPSTLSNPITVKSGSQVQEGAGTLALTATQNGGDFGGGSGNIGPTMTTAPISALNFWQHPVQITLKAPPGGSLMPASTLNGDTDFTANESFLYFELAPQAGLPSNTANQTYFRISNPQNSAGGATGPANQVVTQYVWRSTSSTLNNATPAFTSPQPIDPQGRITSVTLFLDGSHYDPSKGAGGRDSNTGLPLTTNSTPLMFNWGVTDVDRNGVTHTYWLWSTGVAGNGSGAQAADGTRADINFGSGNYGGVGAEGEDLSAVYNHWSQNGTIARSALNGSLGVELLRQLNGDQYPTSVTLGSISVIDPRSPGDVNYDGVVDTKDFIALAANFAGTGPTNTSDNSVNGKIWYQGDMNGDGVVNALDFNILATNFGTNYNSPAPGVALGSAVPEPTALAGLVLAAFGFARRRRA